MSSQVDLSQLARDKRTPAASTARRRRAVLSRYVVPGFVLAGFAALLLWAARDQFVTAKTVSVVPVVVTRAEVQPSGTPLFQAAGWIEPRPTPVLVTALADGVVAELLVVEGQEVEQGEPVARLIEIDARLALQRAESDLKLRQAELASAKARLYAAQQRLEHPVHRRSALAEVEARLAQVERERAQLPYLIEAAEARLEYARQNFEGKQAAGSALAERVLQQATSEHEAARAKLRELEQRSPRLEQEIDAVRRQRDALARQLELLIDESRAVAEGEAQVAAAEARERQAELAVDAARLTLERMVVTAPRDGRVLELVARPGTRVSAASAGADAAASTVATLYDPQLLQVRADVRLEDVPLVQPQQPVEIETASAPQPLRGVVLHATSRADVQKNTLEVKVAILDPPATIRPEMLVTTTFLAPKQPAKSEGQEQPERLLVPRRLVDSHADGATVWVATAEQTAQRRSVRLGRAGTGELVEVVEGLQPTDKLIQQGREGLQDGDRIRITTG